MRPQCYCVLYPEHYGGTQGSVFETVLRLPHGERASGGQVLEAAAVTREMSPEPGDRGAWQEMAGLGAVCGKINVAVGNRTWARSRDPEFLACRLDPHDTINGMENPGTYKVLRSNTKSK